MSTVVVAAGSALAAGGASPVLSIRQHVLSRAEGDGMRKMGGVTLRTMKEQVERRPTTASPRR